MSVGDFKLDRAHRTGKSQTKTRKVIRAFNVFDIERWMEFRKLTVRVYGHDLARCPRRTRRRRQTTERGPFFANRTLAELACILQVPRLRATTFNPTEEHAVAVARLTRKGQLFPRDRRLESENASTSTCVRTFAEGSLMLKGGRRECSS